MYCLASKQYQHQFEHNTITMKNEITNEPSSYHNTNKQHVKSISLGRFMLHHSAIHCVITYDIATEMPQQIIRFARMQADKLKQPRSYRIQHCHDRKTTLRNSQSTSWSTDVWHLLFSHVKHNSINKKTTHQKLIKSSDTCSNKYDVGMQPTLFLDKSCQTARQRHRDSGYKIARYT